MFYIFNKDNKCISSCNAKPNVEDLATRGEFVIEDARDLDISMYEYVDGVIREKAKVEYTPTKAEKIAYIKKYYDERFATLDQALVRRRLINGDITDLQEQYKKLNAEMVSKIKEVE